MVGGRLSLDFVATLTERRHEPVEQLLEPRDLSTWAGEVALVDEDLDVSPDELAEARALREAMHRVVLARTAEGQLRAADIAALNRAARHAPVALQLAWSGGLRRRGDVRQVLASIVRDVLELLDSDQLARVRECDREECTRLYVDASRTRNRRWCDMAECGNRAKVAAFRRRQHGWDERTGPLWTGPPVPLTAIRGREEPLRRSEVVPDP